VLVVPFVASGRLSRLTTLMKARLLLVAGSLLLATIGMNCETTNQTARPKEPTISTSSVSFG